MCSTNLTGSLHVSNERSIWNCFEKFRSLYKYQIAITTEWNLMVIGRQLFSSKDFHNLNRTCPVPSCIIWNLFLMLHWWKISEIILTISSFHYFLSHSFSIQINSWVIQPVDASPVHSSGRARRQMGGKRAEERVKPFLLYFHYRPCPESIPTSLAFLIGENFSCSSFHHYFGDKITPTGRLISWLSVPSVGSYICLYCLSHLPHLPQWGHRRDAQPFHCT